MTNTQRKTQHKPDFKLSNHGSIWLLIPISSEAKIWCKENLPNDAPMFGNAYAIEYRYMDDISNGIFRDGLSYN